MSYHPCEGGMLCYDVGAFHTTCQGVTPVWVGYPALWCPHCKVLSHLDLVASHITPASSLVEREVIHAAT